MAEVQAWQKIQEYRSEIEASGEPVAPPTTAQNPFTMLVNSHFSEPELNTMLYHMKIDFNSIHGSSKDERVVELMKYLERHELTQTFLEQCREFRPRVKWPIKV